MALERGPAFYWKPRTQTTAGELSTAGVYDIEATADAGSTVTLTGASGVSAAATLFQVFPNGTATLGSTSGVASTALANNKGFQLPVRTVMGASASAYRRLRAGEELDFPVTGTATGLTGNDTFTSSWYKRSAAGVLTLIVSGTGTVANVPTGTAYNSVIQAIVPADIIFATDETLYAELYVSVLGQTVTAGTLVVNIGPGRVGYVGLPAGNGIQFLQRLTLTSATTPAGTLKATVVKYFTSTTGSAGALIKTVLKYLTSTQASSGQIIKTPAKRFTAETVPSAGAIVKVDKKLAGSASPSSGILFRIPNKVLSSATQPAAIVIKSLVRVFSGTYSSSGTNKNTIVKHFTGFLYGPSGSGAAAPADYPVTNPTKAVSGTVIDHETGQPILVAATVRLIRDSDDLKCQTVSSGAGGTFTFPRDATDPNTYHYTADYTTAGGVQIHGISDRGIVPA